MDILLFDIDGVLVHPGGYRQALARTISYYSHAMGWGVCSPDEDVSLVFEAHGITNEWDMTAIFLAGMFSAAWQESPGLWLPSSVPTALQAVRAHRIPAQRIKYAELARQIAVEMRTGEYPALAAPRVFARHLSSYSSDGGLQSLSVLLDEILLTTRDIRRSHTLAVFQSYSLGSERYSQTYGLAPILETPSMILQYDRRTLSPENSERILTSVRSGDLKAVIYTARPSLSPTNVDDPESFYPAEAEMAASLSGLSELPLIGFGCMQWLARHAGIDADSYVKPSPVHAIAAIGAAVVEDQKSLLLSSESLALRGECLPPVSVLKGEHIDVIVFEDSSNSIQAVRQAGDILTQVGIPAKVKGYGIATHPEKCAKLAAVGARVFDDVNAALDVIWT